ncbi:MAG: HD domain-containing protein [Desulfobacterales bacterium]|nr:MAG: HD domain-containing protein [Desulfobacterales bacterium]
MKNIANLLFEAKILKEIPRSGFHFLGAGKESVAEHAFSTTFIAYVLSKLDPAVDALKLISMCLVHDLPETRMGDLNTVQKKYVKADEAQAVNDSTAGLPFGAALADLIHEFNAGCSREAQLAHDADQLALILELKSLVDIGYDPPHQWLPHVLKRLQTEIGKKLAQAILDTRRDAWWLNYSVDRLPINH